MMLANMIAVAIVLIRGLFVALNNMCPKTCLAIRGAWVLLAVGAAGILLLDGEPGWPDLLLHCGIAALVCSDQTNPLLKATQCN
ncbi:hypothetical protein AAKU55_004904 [Oxalobacteraceae bacterium GrIS 1.11]